MISPLLLRTAAVSGLLAAVGCLIYLLVSHILGYNPFGGAKYMLYTAGYALFFIGGFKIYRDNFNGFRLRGQEAIILGIVLNLITVVLVGATAYLWLEHTESGQATFKVHKEQLFALLENWSEQMTEDFDEDTYQITKENLEALKPGEVAVDLSIGLSMSGVFHTFLFMLIFMTREPNPAPKKEVEKKKGGWKKK